MLGKWGGGWRKNENKEKWKPTCTYCQHNNANKAKKGNEWIDQTKRHERHKTAIINKRFIDICVVITHRQAFTRCEKTLKISQNSSLEKRKRLVIISHSVDNTLSDIMHDQNTCLDIHNSYKKILVLQNTKLQKCSYWVYFE